MRLLIIGGSDAGISAALRARELDKSAEIAVLLRDGYPNFSICGLPFLLSGETPDWRSLAHRTEFEGIEVRCNHVATAIGASSKRVSVRADDDARNLNYDRLLIATGADPVRPPIDGIDELGVFTLHSMGSAFTLKKYIEGHDVQSAVIVSAGYIGLEMADALTHRGIKVTVISRPSTVLPTVDPNFGELLSDLLKQNGVAIQTGAEVQSIRREGELLAVYGDQFRCSGEVVIVATEFFPIFRWLKRSAAHSGIKGPSRCPAKCSPMFPMSSLRAIA